VDRQVGEKMERRIVTVSAEDVQRRRQRVVERFELGNVLNIMKEMYE
jgi:hypothetical protein